jgi:phage tail-like protein
VTVPEKPVLPTRLGSTEIVARERGDLLRSGGEAMLQTVRGDYRHLAEVVRIGYPIRDARTFIARHLGNPVTYRLVEGKRGERIGRVREIELEPADGGETLWIRAVRLLPDGTQASLFTPDDLVQVFTTITAGGDGSVPPLRANDRVILHVPVRSYLRFLPGLYQGATPIVQREIVRARTSTSSGWGEHNAIASTTIVDADPFRRFLLLFQHMMTTVTDRIDRIPALTDPATADPKFLPWIASWVNFDLDESLPLHQQRELVRRSIRLYRTRGTKAGIEEMVKVLTSAPVRVEERRRPQPTVLGGLTLAGGAGIEDRYLRDEPPGFYVTRPDRAKTSYFVLLLEPREKFKARFGERAPQVLKRIQQIVTHEKPAHVTFTIQFDEGAPT